jgi:hypothetical protein
MVNIYAFNNCSFSVGIQNQRKHALVLAWRHFRCPTLLNMVLRCYCGTLIVFTEWECALPHPHYSSLGSPSGSVPCHTHITRHWVHRVGVCSALPTLLVISLGSPSGSVPCPTHLTRHFIDVVHIPRRNASFESFQSSTNLQNFPNVNPKKSRKYPY